MPKLVLLSMLMKNNPFLDTSTLPRFHEMHPENASLAIDSALSNLATAANQAAVAEPTWTALWEPLFDAAELVERIGYLVAHMYAIKNNNEWRKVHRSYLKKERRAYPN